LGNIVGLIYRDGTLKVERQEILSMDEYVVVVISEQFVFGLETIQQSRPWKVDITPQVSFFTM
jgi:hypothetical protein